MPTPPAPGAGPAAPDEKRARPGAAAPSRRRRPPPPRAPPPPRLGLGQQRLMKIEPGLGRLRLRADVADQSEQAVLQRQSAERGEVRRLQTDQRLRVAV